MTITLAMDDRQLSTIQEVERFTAGTAAALFRGSSRKEKYAWAEATLIRFRYARLRKKERSSVREFIRKITGYSDIQTKRLIGQYLDSGKVLLQSCFNEYLNFHRPCGFATVIVDAKGKEKKIYNVYETPYERFGSLSGAEQYLKPGVSFAELDCVAQRMSDTEYAMMKQKAELLSAIGGAASGGKNLSR
ncbi:MAG: hypothetical protein HYW34_00445 [Candidatus Brennerbacteria bacterium]|nr:hypothetical protein [Candidatus Brennerbacteria bacterium]